MGKKKPRGWVDEYEPLPLSVTDNHTHLPVREEEIPHVEGRALPLDQQLDRATDAGVDKIITVACELPDFAPTLELTNRFGQVRAALAIHPNEAPLHAGITETGPDGLPPKLQPHHCDLEKALSELAGALRHENVVAVGESGLDFFRTAPAGRAAQVASLEAHIEMAKELNLPLQLHDRDAHAQTVEVLKRCKAPEKTVFHCFSGDQELAQICNENGWFASFAGPLTFRANEELREAFCVLRPELVLVETDAPYLTAHPYRGRPNASYLIGYTVREMARLWEIDVQATAEQLNVNTAEVYGRW